MHFVLVKRTLGINLFDHCQCAARILVQFTGMDNEMTEVLQRMLFLNRFNFNVK